MGFKLFGSAIKVGLKVLNHFTHGIAGAVVRGTKAVYKACTGDIKGMVKEISLAAGSLTTAGFSEYGDIAIDVAKSVFHVSKDVYDARKAVKEIIQVINYHKNKNNKQYYSDEYKSSGQITSQHYQEWNALLSRSNRFIQKESDIIQSVIRILIYSKTWYARKAGHLLRAVVYPEMYAEASFAIIDSNDDKRLQYDEYNPVFYGFARACLYFMYGNQATLAKYQTVNRLKEQILRRVMPIMCYEFNITYRSNMSVNYDQYYVIVCLLHLYMGDLSEHINIKQMMEVEQTEAGNYISVYKSQTPSLYLGGERWGWIWLRENTKRRLWKAFTIINNTRYYWYVSNKSYIMLTSNKKYADQFEDVCEEVDWGMPFYLKAYRNGKYAGLVSFQSGQKKKLVMCK